MADPIRKLAAIMFTDIAGFTALSSIDEEGALKLLDQQREILKPIVEKHKGDWLKEIGDGLLLSFPSSKEAVNCAIEIQHILKEVKNLDLRIGIHQGDILEKGGDIFGDDVNIASRMEPFAAVGGVAISHKVAGDISSSPEFKLKLIGEPKLKGVRQQVKIYCITSHNLPETDISKVSAKLDSELKRTKKTTKLYPYMFVGIVAVILALFLYPKLFNGKTETFDNSKSIAVLPFSAFSSEEEDLFFADGVHDDILTQLSKIHDLKVISRTSVMGYKNTTKKIKEIAKELNVANILEGSVRRAGSQIRIVAQLINAATDEHLWSETYDRYYADIFAIQSDVAQKIASALKATLTPEEKSYIEEKPTTNMEAYDYFLKGNYYWNTAMGKAGILKAVEMYEKAVELDSDFALAYARLSIAHLAFYNYHTGDERTEQRLQQVKATLEKALSLDPDHPEVHLAQGYYYSNYQTDYDRALDEYEIAFEGQPNNGEIASYIGTLYHKMGQQEKSDEYIITAYTLDPRNIGIAFGFAHEFREQGDWERAKLYYNLAINANPEVDYYNDKAWIYIAGYGDLVKARQTLEEGMRNADPGPLAGFRFWTEVYARDHQEALKIAGSLPDQGNRTLLKGFAYYFLKDVSAARAEFDSARVIYEQLLKDDPENEEYHGSLGLAYAGLGMKEAAIREREKAVELRVITYSFESSPSWLWNLVDIYIMTGEYDLAIDQFEHLLPMPGLVTKWVLNLDPRLDPLRDFPRFQQLVAGE